MTRKRNTKRALLASVLSMMLCLTMLIGSTFAWFTNNVSVKGNKIQAGTLKIKLYNMEATDLMEEESWKQNDITDSVEPLFADTILWEPGYIAIANLRVENVGNLAAKVKANLIATSEIGELAEVIDVYTSTMPLVQSANWGVSVNGREWFEGESPIFSGAQRLGTLKEVIEQEILLTTEDTIRPQESTGVRDGNSDSYVCIALKMQEDAGNEYQNKTAGEFDIRISATQATVEEDSYDDQYDKDAEYEYIITFPEDVVADGTWYDESATELTIDDAADFIAFVETAYTWGVDDAVNVVPTFEGVTVTLNADVDLAGYNWTAIAPYDAPNGFKGTFDGNGHTIYNMYIDNTNATGRGYVLGLFGVAGDGAVFKNLTLDGAKTYSGNSNAGALVGFAQGNVTFENITVKNALIKTGRQAGGIVGIVNGGTTNFVNCAVEDSAVLTFHNDVQGPLYGGKKEGAVVNETSCTVTNVVEHQFTDWNRYVGITLAEALVEFADEPASNDN